jgi:hypothetical protein
MTVASLACETFTNFPNIIQSTQTEVMRIMRGMISRALAVGLLILGSLSVAQAADCQKKVQLQITAAGAAIDSSGAAEVRSRGRRQRLKVSIDARVADGTTYAVFVNNQLAGTLTISLGDGELELDSGDGANLPAGVTPVCGISTVDVKDSNGTIILHGTL